MARSHNPVSRFGLWAVFVILAVLPLILRGYQLRLVTEVIIFSLYAVSYNLLLGYAGLLSFGHAMFFGTGAFAVAILLEHFAGLPLLLAVTLATAFTTATGFVVGCLLLRVKGTPFALLTLAFNALFYAIAVKWSSLTGGDDGLIIDPPQLDLWLLTLDPNKGPDFYYLSLAILGPVILFCWYFTYTAMGRTVLLMRENEDRMRFLGYNTLLARLSLFTLTAGLAGLAGSIYSLFFAFVSIDAISIETTTTVLLMTFIGGTGHFAGPILGAGVFIYLQNFLSELTENWPLIMGVLFILMVLFTPGGLVGIIKGAAQWTASRRKTPDLRKGAKNRHAHSGS
ncbi:MAG: branched-chain amino acid ABC transporter permease [Deltaproteobacteria bacterium]|nr:branched-chain amino acid ABC transporter permease [Deltaproteobacteria bacterium]